MLGSAPFYFRTLRRNVIAFGSMFKDIVMIKYANDYTETELTRQTVPLSYEGKENFITRLNDNANLDKPVEITLPRMSFFRTGIAYDADRKLSAYLNNFNKTPGSNTVSLQHQGVPYNINFELYIYARNVEDGDQIVEQIIPFFAPDYTLSMTFVDSMNITREVPIVLDQIDYSNEYTGDAKAEERILVWTLHFTMKTFFFGPVSGGSIIKTATANIFSFSAVNSESTLIDMTVANTGLGTFKYGETVYQGNNLQNASAIGNVYNWNPTGHVLTINNIQGKFYANANVHGALSAASYLVTSTPKDVELVNIVVTPAPPSSNGPPEDFGYSTIIKEWPKVN